MCPLADLLSSPDLDSSVFMETDELKFHALHGRNAAVINNGYTAVRTNDTGEFNDAIVMSSRGLRDNEVFEVVIEKLVDRWSGSLEAGEFFCVLNWLCWVGCGLLTFFNINPYCMCFALI